MNPPQFSDRLALRRFSVLLTITCGIAFFLISLGSLVRAAQAGLSCPDWPLCFGEVVPVFDTAIFLEWFHRAIAGLLAVLTTYLAIRIFSSPLLRKALGVQIAAAMILLAIQIILGGLTVLKLLEAKTVSAHLLNALLFYAILVWMTFRVRRLAMEPSSLKAFHVPVSVKILFSVMIIALFVQIALGGMVSSNFAGMVCPDFPKCHGEWLPPNLFPFVIQMLHRAAGFVVLAIAVLLRLASLRVTMPKIANIAVNVVPWLLVVQIGLGVINVVYALPMAASAAHLANAVAIYTLMILAALAVFNDSKAHVRERKQGHSTLSVTLQPKDQLL